MLEHLLMRKDALRSFSCLRTSFRLNTMHIETFGYPGDALCIYWCLSMRFKTSYHFLSTPAERGM